MDPGGAEPAGGDPKPPGAESGKEQTDAYASAVLPDEPLPGLWQ